MTGARQRGELFWDSVSDDELDHALGDQHSSSKVETEATYGGSRLGRAANIDRQREPFAQQLHQDYLSASQRTPNICSSAGSV